MEYVFFEYQATEMIPGDWEWYLNSYTIESKSGARSWSNSNSLVAQAYEVPQTLSQHVVTAISFTPMNAKRYIGMTRPAPGGFRWGILTCLRSDFAALLGTALAENAVIGRLQLPNGDIVHEWQPNFIRNRISIPVGQEDGAEATAKHLDGKAIYSSDRYLLILRKDVYASVGHFRLRGCKITKSDAEVNRTSQP